MATKLDKDITRETSVIIGEKEVSITLTKEQEIKLKLKGERKKPLTIKIQTLYEELSGITPTSKGPSTTKEKKESNMMISLYDLRSHNLIQDMDQNTQLKFEQVILSVINSNKLTKGLND
jgi:hypothetical protein